MAASGQGALLDPVDVKLALRKQPLAVCLDERIVVAERRDHKPPLCTVDGEVMRERVRLPRRAIIRQSKNRALSDKMHRGGVFVQIVEHRSERLARMQLLGW